MTPKGKAKELVDKFGFALRGDDKQSALICVDEILEVLSDTVSYDIIYFREVKEEINKL